MNLSNLSKIKTRGKKRLGQGYGSGKGKTAGRGTKGQKARDTIPQRIKLGGVSFVKRLPLIRGKLRQKRITSKPLVINLKDLQGIKQNTVIDMDFLVVHKFLKKDEAEIYTVKILGDGEIKTPITVRLKTSKNARKKIEKAGEVPRPIEWQL